MLKQSKNEYDFLKLYKQFIVQCEKGKHLQNNGKLIRRSSIRNYKHLEQSLLKYEIKQGKKTRIKSLNKLGLREVMAEKKYWAEFYLSFTNFLFIDRNCFDNYVGSTIKMLRSFFNFLNDVKSLNIGSFHKKFYSYNEEIDILTLLPEQLNFLIYNKEFESKLNARLKRTKDVFVFGCTVALRCSDILNLTYDNIDFFNGKNYLKVKSQKTNTLTRILLPQYAVEIIKRQDKRRKTIFLKISNINLNEGIKDLIEAANWTQTIHKTRNKRGIPHTIYKNVAKKEHYRFCDLVSSHTMRRTAITTMLCLGMPEALVRKISGHAPGSKEFYKYVQLSQLYMDHETEKLHETLASLRS